MKWSKPAVLVVGAIALAGALAGLTGVRTATSQAVTLKAVAVSDKPEMNPDWATWAKVPSVDVQLTNQAVTYPKGGGTVPAVSLKAVHHEGTLYLRATWKDKTENVPSIDMTSFTDAVALEFPGKSAVSVPSFCMGQPSSGVNIWQWKADAQAGAGAAAVAKLYPNGYADSAGFPEELTKAALYQPALGLNNPVARTDASVQTLVAQAFGTLSPAAAQDASGAGMWRNGEWSVVFTRPFKAADGDQAEFAAGKSTNLAVAVWDGANGDRAGQKNVSQFVTLQLSGELVQAKSEDMGALWFGAILGGILVVIGLAALGWAGMAGAPRGRA